MVASRRVSTYRSPVLPLRKRSSGAAAIVLGALLLAAQAEATIVERVVAIVGENAILLTDVKERARPFLVRVFGQVPEGPQRSAAISQIYKVVLERMVDETLEDKAAERAGIDVTDREVDEALERVAAQNSMTPGAILAEAKRTGMTVDQYRDELRRQVLQSKLGMLRLQGRVQIDETDLRGSYARLTREERMQLPQRTARIIVPAGTGAAAEAASKRVAAEIAERARRGEPVASLIGAYPVAPGSGLSEPRPPASEPATIMRASLSLEVGETSGPLRVADTWVIIQVLEREPSSIPPYEEARAALQDQVYMEKLARVRRQWLEGLRRRTHVELRM